MFLLPKLESLFSIVAAFIIMQYEFENRTILEVSEKLTIASTNPQICYLIIEVSYINSLLIIKLIILGIKFEFLREISFASDIIAKSRKKIRLGQCILK